MSDNIRAFVHLANGAGDGTRVGAVAEIDGQIVFQYTPEFIASGQSLSPLMLPLIDRVFRFPELRDQDAFHGLPGLLADSLPDRFGTRLIEAYFQQSKGLSPEQLSPVQKLLYVGDRAMGALTYRPALPIDGPGMREPITLQRLREQAQRAVAGEPPDAIPQIMAAASSAGGMRAKALVYWNRQSNSIAVGSPPASPLDEPWMIKFDGVGADGEPQVWTRLEYAYNLMAREAGVQMPESTLIAVDQYQHYAVRRFDITPAGRRLHVHSLCGLQHVDFNVPHLAGYELLMQSCLDLGLGAGAMRESFKRMVFNIMACNQDDHTKNIAFIMDPQTFVWDLAPAYDITYAHGKGYTATHQMTVNGKDSNIAHGDLMAVAERYSIPRPQAVIEDVAKAVTQWRTFADQAKLPADWIKRVEADHHPEIVQARATARKPRRTLGL